MKQKKKITLIIPCRNEAAALHSMLQKVPHFIDEIIVVDNNSTDRTAKIAKRHNVSVYKEKRTQNGIGYGFAHRTGIKKATGDIIVAMDGDDTYPLNAVKNVIDYMQEGDIDFVSCARFPLSNRQAISRLRQFGVAILNLEASILYGRKIHDILTGMWVAKKSALDTMSFVEGGWDFSPEIKLEAISNPSITFSEYHIGHTIRMNGLSKQQIWKTGFGHMRYILARKLTKDSFRLVMNPAIILKPLKIGLRSLLAVIMIHKS